MSTMPQRTIVAAASAAALLVFAIGAQAQPRWGSESSPAPSTSTSERVNERADKAMYREVDYTNKGKRGPALIVIPGEIKSNNATFTQRFLPNNIADFAELELSNANFPVLERTNLGPLMNEFALAYNLGDPAEARKMLGRGKLKSTKWVVRFDILKAEQVAAAKEGFDGGAVGSLIGIFGGGSMGGAAASTVAGSVRTSDSSGVWIIGMRYKIMNAETTEQVAQGYTEEKMEVGAKGTSVLGMSKSDSGGVSLDTMVQRLVQKNVWEIDNKYK